MDEIAVEGLLGVSLVTHQAMFLDPSENGLFLRLWQFLAIEIGLHPHNVFASFEAPLLHQLPGILEVVGSSPKKHKRRTVADLGHVNLLELF